MKLKRLYDRVEDEFRIRSVIKILHAGPRQRFSPSLVEQGAGAGWLSVGDGKITLNGEAEKVTYAIERTPGLYCSHCKKKLDDSPSAQEHVKAAHGGTPSPDKSNPAGYEQINFYDCTKV
jgi:hypothetical protein